MKQIRNDSINTRTAGVWVKASERLPDKTSGYARQIVCRWTFEPLKNGEENIQIRTTTANQFLDVAKITHDLSKVEWLDESIPTLTIQQALEVWESALDWDYNMKEEHDYKRTYFLNKFGIDIDKIKV